MGLRSLAENTGNLVTRPLSRLFHDFFHSEKAGGIILILCTIASLFLANSRFQTSYLEFWSITVYGHTISHWINDGLMVIFFLMIGLELEREIYSGELSSLKRASLPFFGALGGMILPAIIYKMINFGTATQNGTGIPMATDIAFAIGVLSLLGKRIPDSLKIFLVALAVMDDLGAIIVIALFYTKIIVLSNLLIALGIFGLLVLLNRLKVMNLIPYILGGVIMWYFMLNSGIHATITGVLLAFAIPYGKGDERSPSYLLQHFLHMPVAFLILPLFALANTGLVFNHDWHQILTEPLGLGVIFGLFIGKPLGILLFSLLGIALGLCVFPTGITWKHILGVGFLGGIGFTMSIFVTLLAFEDKHYIDGAKIAIICASLLSGVLGFLWLLVITNLKSEHS